MKKNTVLLSLLTAAMAASLTIGELSPVHAQSYPTRNITMIVPFPAGGPSDIVARIAAEGMSRHIGQNIIIENVGGAGGTIGATRAAEAKGDGYTIFAASMGTIIAAPSFYPNLKYDSNKDFEPIGMSANAPAAISIKTALPAKTMQEFVSWAKPKGAEVKQAHGGVGGTAHMACLLFNKIFDLKPTQVAYRGMGPGMNDLMGGHVDYLCEQAVVMVSAIQGEKVRGIVVAGPERLAAIPDVPTSRKPARPTSSSTSGARSTRQRARRRRSSPSWPMRSTRRLTNHRPSRSSAISAAPFPEGGTRPGSFAQDRRVRHPALGSDPERSGRNHFSAELKLRRETQ